MAKACRVVHETRLIGQSIMLVGKHDATSNTVTVANFEYIHRFADRDMMMRFHVGLGIGHAYAHGLASHHFETHSSTEGPPGGDDEELDLCVENTLGTSGIEDSIGDKPNDEGSLGREGDETNDIEDQDGLDDEETLYRIDELSDNEVNDEELLAMHEMYG